MNYTLNDRAVCEALHVDAKNNKQRGIRSFFVVIDSGLDDAVERRLREALANKTYCANCEGAGKHGLQILTGGPFTNANDKKHVTWFNGQWYTQKTDLYICPICNGSGLFGRQAARPAAVLL